ncbi:MAG: hypothetical protein ACK5T0_07885 [Vampirovibrionales bacterium]|jgi:hypothetical protein
MIYPSFTRLACFSMLAVSLVIPNVQAESVKLSAIVHEPPTNGYIFTALAPLPKLMPDMLVKATPPVASTTADVPTSTTTLDVKKKP